jgi:hypothetical protein
MNMMLEYSFLTNIDRFYFQSGTQPILITGDHAFSNNKEGPTEFAPVDPIKEEQLHLSDIAVHPILSAIGEHREYFIIENLVQRSVVDMNRPEARLNDENEWNDYFYRQVIRYCLQYITTNMQCLPFLLDLHSYPKESDYGEDNTEILLLIQPSTNQSLVRFTEQFFKEKGWRIAHKPASNVNDVVLEIAQLNLGIPLLMEINEANLEPTKFTHLIDDLRDYLLKIAEKVKIMKPNSIRFSSDAMSGVRKPAIHKMNNYFSMALLHDFPMLNDELQQALKQYLLLSALVLMKSQDGYTDYCTESHDSTSIEEYVESNQSFDPSDSYQTILDMINVVAQSHQSLIIPLELIEISMKMLLSNINRKFFEEWGLESDTFIQNVINNPNFSQHGIYLPAFKENPLATKQIKSIFSVYSPTGKYFYHSFILSDMNLINPAKVDAELSKINRMLNLTKNKMLSIKTIHDQGTKAFQFILKNVF